MLVGVNDFVEKDNTPISRRRHVTSKLLKHHTVMCNLRKRIHDNVLLNCLQFGSSKRALV